MRCRVAYIDCRADHGVMAEWHGRDGVEYYGVIRPAWSGSSMNDPTVRIGAPGRLI